MSSPGIDTFPRSGNDPGEQTRWLRLESLFLSAAGLHPAERAAFLDRECAGDLGLRAEAASLLELDEVAARDIEALIQGAAASFFTDEPLEGALLGPWRVVREIGRGGMGSVYLAVREGADFEKRVAIKLIKRDLVTASVKSRFLDERRILAGLDHPYIARLIDGDTTPDGRPYFIMEYVEGVALGDYCFRENLTTRERCELFRRICEPVSFAHGKLVIHRDLKPANILITADGTPRLLDFGIAKLVTNSPGDENAFGHLTVALTPQYASPEQLRAESVDTATDIYSLGVILRELLGGNGPEDLTSIVTKATMPERAQRYRSVEQLSHDVELFLEARPVSAHGDSLMYRARRFVKRNRLPVAASIAALTLLAAAIGSVLWESHQARVQRERAQERLGQMVEMANRALFDVQTSIERLPGTIEARRNLVKSTIDYLDKLHQESSDDGIEDARLLSTLAAAYAQVANIEGSPLVPNLGDMTSAQENFSKAAKIIELLIARDPANMDFRVRSGKLHSDHAEMLADSGHISEAKALFKHAIEELDYVVSIEPRNFAARQALSVAHLRLNDVISDENPEEGRKAALEQLPLNETLLHERPDDIDSLLNVASTWSQIGKSYSRQGDQIHAIDAFRKTAELRERAISSRPHDVTARRDLLIAYGHVGDTLGSPFIPSMGNYAGAIEWYIKAAGIAREMSQSDPSDKRSHLDLGIALMRVGASQWAANRFRDALDSLNASSAILDPLSSGSLVNVSSYTQSAILYEYRARVHQSLGQPDLAIADWRRSLEICGKVLSIDKARRPCQKQLVLDRVGLAIAEADLGNSEEALSEVARARQQATQSESGTHLMDKSYQARSEAGTGAVYMLLAKRDATYWRDARDYYKLAVQHWHPIEKLDPQFAEESRIAVVRLAECERALNSR